MVESYDGEVLRFSISEVEAKSRFLRDSPPLATEGLSAPREAERAKTTVPITEERLNVSKRESSKEATIIKEPVTN
jgi:hypothetical protein